jgi:hypothetical protein
VTSVPRLFSNYPVRSPFASSSIACSTSTCADKHQDGDIRCRPASVELRRHPDVDHRQVGPLPAGEFDEPGSVTGRAEHLKPQAVEQARQAFTQHNVVVGQDDPGAAPVPMNIIDPARAVVPAGRK